MTAGRILIGLIPAAPASWALPLSLSSKKNVCKRGEHQLTLCFSWSSSAVWLMVWREKILLAWTQRVTWRIAVMYCLLHSLWQQLVAPICSKIEICAQFVACQPGEEYFAGLRELPLLWISLFLLYCLKGKTTRGFSLKFILKSCQCFDFKHLPCELKLWGRRNCINSSILLFCFSSLLRLKMQ